MRRQQIAAAVHIKLMSEIVRLDGSGTTAFGVIVTETSPLALGKLLTVVDPGPLTLKLKKVSFPVGSVVGIGVPPVAAMGL